MKAVWALFVVLLVEPLVHGAKLGTSEWTSRSPVVHVGSSLNRTKLNDRVKRAISGTRLSYGEKMDFLKAHNDFRRKVNPPAANMQLMRWNNKLAAMAQEWADGCRFEHGQPEENPTPYHHIGQNLFATTATTVSGAEATQSWYNEVNYFSFADNRCEPNKVCGHYTQVVWAKSNTVGCAIADCMKLEGTSFGTSKLVVCNYGPAGNYVGQKPYVEGKQCSACPTGTTCNSGLCAPERRRELDSRTEKDEDAADAHFDEESAELDENTACQKKSFHILRNLLNNLLKQGTSFLVD